MRSAADQGVGRPRIMLDLRLEGDFVFSAWSASFRADSITPRVISPTKEDNALGGDFKGGTGTAVVPGERSRIAAFIRVQPALNEDLSAFAKILMNVFSEVPPSRNTEPGCFFNPLPVALGVGTIGCNRDVCDGLAAGRVPHFRISTQPTDDNEVLIHEALLSDGC